MLTFSEIIKIMLQNQKLNVKNSVCEQFDVYVEVIIRLQCLPGQIWIFYLFFVVLHPFFVIMCGSSDKSLENENCLLNENILCLLSVLSLLSGCCVLRNS